MQVQTGVGDDGTVSVSVNTGSAAVVVDVFGWYGDGSESEAASGYTALQPQRLLDTRDSGQPSRCVAGRDHQGGAGDRPGRCAG